MADEHTPLPPPRSRVMDIKPPAAAKQPIAPDHQLTQHGTPDAPEADTHQQAIADALLEQVEVEHATVSSHSKIPVGLIVATVTVLIILVAISWFALSARP